MYKFDVRSGFGRELAAHQLRQHKISQVSSNSSESSGYFLLSFLDKNKRIGQVALALLTGCVVSILAGCGGVTYNASTRALSAISCANEVAYGSTVDGMLSESERGGEGFDNGDAFEQRCGAERADFGRCALQAQTTVGFNAVSEAVSNQ